MKTRRPRVCAFRWLALAGALLCSCGLRSAPSPGAAEPPRLRARDDASSRSPAAFLPWAADEAELLIVDKTHRLLELYRAGVLVKTYPVVLGRNSGRKLYEGDRRTPSGVYRITDKRPHARFARFLAINYPNERDLRNYRAARDGNGLPRGVRQSPGGLIGIHGSDKEDLNEVGINWTFGCVSLRNEDVKELYSMVEPGTLVLIEDDQQP